MSDANSTMPEKPHLWDDNGEPDRQTDGGGLVVVNQKKEELTERK